ncbi:unnamed protein product [Bursaphelenchus xylophilus]|uniref:(pine wood nematode) hypothetical protein n=1 Tax=Bursaphelenchus xylophilus TaxID=6326 RepID=A0A1I7RUT0_BURXY|nr:unnamed protein product [Bursaphelenchus xylophilus]CAG9105488.1 unnamed protein product [Bursaphelenchus xylophilus]
MHSELKDCSSDWLGVSPEHFPEPPTCTFVQVMHIVFLIHIIAELVIGILSVVLTLVLLRVVWQNRTPRLRVYSWILILNGVADLVFALCNLTLMEGVEILDNSLFLFSTSFFYHSSQTVTTIATAVWLTSLYMAFAVLPINYYYRYRQLSTRPLTIFQYVCLYCLALLYVGAHCFSVFWFTVPKNAQLDKIITSVEYYADPPAYIVSDSSLPGCVYHLLHSTIQVAGSYLIVAYFAMKIRSAILEQRNRMSTGAKRTDNQIMTVMFVQCMCPGVVLTIPIGICASAPLFGQSVPLLGLILTTVMGLIPICNSLSALLIVGTYRQAVKRMIGMEAPSSVMGTTSKGPASKCDPTVSPVTDAKSTLARLEKKTMTRTYKI